MNRCIREPYVQWCERRTPSVFAGGAVYSITIRFSFLSGQSYSKFRIVKSSSLKVFPPISLRILKIVRQSCQAEKSSQVCRVKLSSRAFHAELFVPGIRRASRAEKSKLSWKGFSFVKLGFLSG